jgi:hypothetical protein
MSAVAVSCPESLPNLHAGFLALSPRIELHARIFFRHVNCPQKKDDCIAETIGIAWKWYVPLVQRGKDPALFVTKIASLAARHVRAGRRVCGQEKSKDVMSGRAQQRHGFSVGPLPSSTMAPFENLYSAVHGQEKQDAFEERLRDNSITPVLDQVVFRLDFPAWLKTLTARERRMIRAMANNERTKDLSKQFELSPGRISQMRREFQLGWDRFCGGSRVGIA